MKNAVIYIHGKGGNAEEAVHFQSVFPDDAVIGLDYAAQTPWDAGTEFPVFFDTIAQTYPAVTVIANSIGAYFTMCALSDRKIQRAFFISPIVHMEQLICDRMRLAGISEEELRSRGEIQYASGETLSWAYLRYVREHPVRWQIPTHILYGGRDLLTSRSAITDFAGQINATLTVMENGEHWFHTDDQMRFLDAWMKRYA